MKKDLEKLFDDEFNAYAEITHYSPRRGVVVEQMPCMNKEKFVEVVYKLLKRDEKLKSS